MAYTGLTELTIETQQKSLATLLARLLRDTFGKGPEAIHVVLASNYVVIYLKGFMSPLERVLLDSGQEETVISVRVKLMEQLVPEIKGYISVVTGVDVSETYFDWSFTNLSGVIVCVVQPMYTELLESCYNYVGKLEVDALVSSISAQVERTPDSIESMFLNDRMLLIVRKGLLVPIEKELIRVGHQIALKVAKLNLEKRYLHNSSHFAEILQRNVADVFVDWDFIGDQSVIVCIVDK